MRVAVVGTGWWATHAHLPALIDDRRVQVVGIADPSPERLAAASRAFAIAETYPDHRRLLAAERPDAVVVATPHATHYEIARDVLNAGASVLVEKPMTLCSSDADDLVRRADANGLHLVVGYTWNFNPHVQRIRSLVAARRIGDLLLAAVLQASRVVEFLRGRPERYREAFGFPVVAPLANTYSDPALSGGGQGWTQVTHATALLLWTAQQRPVEVSALTATFGERVDVVGAVAARLDRGALATIASLGTVSGRQAEQLELRLHGSDGAIVADLVGGTAAVHDANGAVEPLPPLRRERIYPFRAPARHLVDLLRGEAENLAPGSLGADAVSFVESVYRSGSSPTRRSSVDGSGNTALDAAERP